MAARIKVTCKDETRVIPQPALYLEFMRKVNTIFGQILPPCFLLTYVGSDAKTHEMTCQEDYALAIKDSKGCLKVTVQDSKPGPTSVYREDISIGLQEPVVAHREEVPANAEANVASSYSCFFCNGAKGKLCKKCQGTGILPEHTVGKIREIIKKEMASLISSEVRSQVGVMMSQGLGGSVLVSKRTEGNCAGCKKALKEETVQYQCSACANYYLCEACESKGDHHHPLLKLRFVPQQPAVKESGAKPMKDIPTVQKAIPVYKMSSGAAAQTPSDLYHASSMTDSPADGYKAKPGEAFVKTWRLKNSGNSAWPADTLFKGVSGESVTNTVFKVGVVQPKAEIDCQLNVIAPSKPGRYTQFCQLCTGKDSFGPRVWVEFSVIGDEIQVPKKEEEKGASSLTTVNPADALKQKADLRKKQLEELKVNPSYKENLEKLVGIYETMSVEMLYDLLVQAKNKIEDVTNMMSTFEKK